MVIDATTNPPTGKTLSIVLTGSDGTATPQKAARQDRLYTISVRYVPAIEARVEDSSKNPITDVVELTLLAGNHLVGSIAASGGVGGDYSYALTPNTHLEVDAASGEIRIKAGTTPLPGDGLSITANIAVDDDKDSTDTDRGETPAVNVQIRVKYVELEPLTFTAKDLAGNDVAEDASVGTFYLLQGQTLTERLLVATVTASGGIKDYKYALASTGGGLTFDTATREVHIADGQSAGAPGATAERRVTLKATDSQKPTANEKLLTVRAVFERVLPHGDLVGTSAAGVEGDLSGTMTVRRVAADNNAIDVVSGLNPANVSAEDLSVEGAAGDLTYNTAAKKLQIKENVAPDGKTLVLTLKAADKDSVNDREDAARPDRLFTLSVVYAGLLEAAAINTEGNAPIAAAVNRYVASDTGPVEVATLSVSGGTAPYTYAIEGELELHGANSATVRIPESAVPAAHPGTTLTARITVNDTNRADTLPLILSLTVHYILGAGHANLTGNLAGGGAIDNLEAKALAFVRPTSSGTAQAVVSDVGFARGVANEVLSTTGGELEFVNRKIRIAANANPEGQTLTLELKATDGDDSAEAIARRDRLYTVRVRYVKSLSAKARVSLNGADILATRDIKVPTGQTTKQAAAYIDIDGGVGEYALNVVGSDFELDGRVLSIKDGTAAASGGKLLTATVQVNDNESEVGGSATPEVEVTVTVNYIALPLVAGSFVNTAGVKVEAVLDVYGKAGEGTLTIAATAKAEVSGNSGENYTFAEVGEGPLEIDESTGVISIPDSVTPTGQNLIITVRFVGEVGRSVPTTEILTVNYKPVSPISSTADGFQSVAACHPGDQIKSNSDGSLITVMMETMEAGDVWNAGSDCQYQASGAIALTGGSGSIAGVAQNIGGLALTTSGNEHRVSVVGGTRTYTDSNQTLSIVIAYNDEGAGSHITDEYLRTIYVVFPGVPKIEAVLEDASNAGVAITDPLTVVVAAAGSVVVASLEVSGGEGGEYSYTGTALDGTPSLAVNEQGKISVPAGLQPQERPGTTLKYEVAVDDKEAGSATDATRLSATSPQKVTLTLVYIKSAGPLAAEAVIANPAFADATATTFYSEANKALTAPINVAGIAPSGGLPPYKYAVVGGQNAALGISGASGNNVQVQLKVGDTPGGADRVAVVEVFDSGDEANPATLVSKLSLTLTVKFVGVAGHNDLAITPESGIVANGNGEYVAVRAGTQNAAVNLLSGISTNGTLSRTKGDAELVWTYDSNTNSGGLAITAGTEPKGQKLSVVLSASDGDDTPQKAARKDRLYSMTVRYVPALAAEVRTADGSAALNGVVEITSKAGARNIASIAVSGGTSPTYDYVARQIHTGGNALEVSNDGVVSIPSGVNPTPGAGLSLTVEISANDKSDSEDNGVTDAAKATVTVKYVLLEDLVLTAKDLGGNDVGAEASVGTFYLEDAKLLPSAVLVASVTASGGILPHIYALESGDGLTFNPAANSRALHIAKDKAAATPDTAGATLSVAVKVTDKRGETATLTVRAVFERVLKHGDLIVNSGSTNLGTAIVSVVATADTNPRVISEDVRPTNGETDVNIVEVKKAGLEYVGGSLRIVANAVPDGRTLSVELRATDGGNANDRTDKAGARPDQLYTVQLRYIRELSAAARTADGSAVLNAPVVTIAKPGTTHQVASISVSGGVTSTYTLSSAPVVAGGTNLEVSNDGIVSIPTGVTPVANGGLSITVEITADDSGKDSTATDAAKARVTVVYNLLESPELVAQNLAGDALTNSNKPTFYLLSGATLASDLPVAKVVGSKGSQPYTFSIVNAVSGAKGLKVEKDGGDGTIGNIALVSGESAAAAGSADKVITVRLTDSQTPAETKDVILTIRFEAVAPHPDLTGGTGGEHVREFGLNDNLLTVLVNAGETGKQVVVRNVAVAASPSSAVPVLTTTKGDLDFDASAKEISIPDGTVPTGQHLSVVLSASDGADTEQAAARPDRLYSLTVRYLSSVSVGYRTENDGAEIDGSDGITVRVIPGTTRTSVFVAKLSASGGVGEYTYSISDHGGSIQLDATNGVLWISSNFDPVPESGAEVNLQVSAVDTDDTDNATPNASRNLKVVYLEQAQTTLTGEFEAAAPSSNSRIEGAFDASKRVTVYGLAADGISENLTVVGLSHNNDAIDTNAILQLQGSELGYANGKVFIPATLRQSYGELTGAFITHNNRFLPATYSLTVLLVQRLDNVTLTEGNDAGKGQYFFTAGNEDTPEYRPIFGMPAMPEGAFSMNPGNYRYDHANKRMLRNGQPIYADSVGVFPRPTYNGPYHPQKAQNHRVTVFDSSPNPKILPRVFDLNLRHRRLPALAFVSPDTTATLAHDESPSTPVWTFRVEGGALTRKPYRPFHNFAVRHEGAAVFNVVTLARVQDPDDAAAEFVDIEVRVNFADNAFIQRRGQTLTLTVTAEDIGYPGLGAAEHVAELVLSKPPLQGGFEGSTLTSGSRIVGAFDASKRVTVSGLAADNTTDKLPVINLSHSNTQVNASRISKQAGSGDLDYDVASGQVFIPATNRKNFGTEFTGVFVATDGNSGTQDATYSITVLLAERLDDLQITNLNSDSAEYFYTTGSEGATEFRPIARLSTTLSGLELSTPGSNYQWDATSGEIRRNGAPPASDGAGNLFTLSDPNANPKIVPKAYDLNIRGRALEALSFVNAPAATTILHNETPTTPVWTFQVRGGALTRKPYRPFHNFEVKHEGAAPFSVATLARVQDTNDSNAEFVGIAVNIDFNHSDASERRGQTLTLTVTAEDIGYPGLGAAEHVVEVVLAAGPLTGAFVDSALTSNSRIVGAFDASKRVTVYGLTDDTGNLPVINLSHNNANVNVGDISKQSGDLDYASGQVFIPAAMRKNFGTEFTGVFAANDNNPQTDSATYSITVLLLERLEGTARGQALFVDAGRPDNHRTPSRGQFFHTATESTLFRPVLTFPGITVEGLEARSADNNYRWDFATKRLLRNGAPSGNNDNRLVTMVDPSANPKILPAPLTLDIRDRLVPSLEFVNSNTTAPQIAHDDTPTTAIWTFQVYGGALTRQTYRPFHNFQLSHTGAFSVVTLGRSTNANGAQLANYQIKVDFTHPDAVQRRGQTLTVTVTAEDTGYPGLGSASHVAEVVLQRSQLPALTGNFVDSALTSGSQIEGNFVGGGGRITVFGTEADSTTEDLALFNLSFDNNSANVSFTGNGLAWRGGTLYLLGANRKQWGSVYSGNLLASDNNPQTLDKAYGVNVLVSEKLSNVAFEGVNPQNQQAVYFYGIGRKAVTDKRQVAVFNLPRTGLQLDAPSGFGFELADSKLRMGYSLPGGFIGDVAPSTHIFTLRDPGATPKIIPVKLTLTVSYEEIRPVTHGSVLTVDVEHRQPGDVKGVIEFIPGANPGGLFGQSYLGHSGFSRSVESFGLTVQGNPAVQAGFKLDIDGTSSDLSAFEKVSAVITYSNNVPSVPEIKLTAEALYLPSELDVFFGINFRTWRSAFINNFPASVNRLTPRGVELANGTAQLFQLNVGNNGVDAENVRPSMKIITNDGFVLTQGSNLGWNVAIVSTLTPAQYGQTLTLIVKLDDNDATFGKFTDAETATLRVKYGLDPIAATTVLDSNDDPISDIANIDIERNAEDGISVFVGKIKPSGGTGTGYTFSKVPGSGELEVASNGDVYIPASQTPLETGEGRQLSMVVTVGGSGGATGAKVTLHVDYLAVLVFDPLTAKAQTPQGADLTGGDAGTFYRLTTDGTLNSALAVAKVAASGGRAPLKYERVGAENGLRVRDSGDNIGEVYIWNGEAAAAGNAAERKITVKVSDSQSTAESVNVEITARFVAVNPHDDMVGTPAAEVEGNFLTEALTVRRVVADSGAIDVLSDAAPANEAAEVLAVVGTAGDLTYDAAAKKVRIAAGVSPNGQTLTLTLEVSDADSVNDGEDAARPNRQFVISAVYAGLLEAAAYDSANSAKVTGEINRYVAANEDAAVNVATLSVSGGAASYTFAITGGLELHGDNSMTVRIPADATPILSPGTKLTAQIVIDDTGRNDTLPLTLQLTANYILGAAHSDLTATQGTKAIENLEANVLTLVRSESSNAAVAVVSGVGFKESVANQSLSGTNGELEFVNNEIRVAANVEPNGQTLTLQLTGTDGDSTAAAAARSDRIYIVRVRYLKPLNLLFAASALQASRVVGDFSGERITVYGKATDSENTNLQLFNVANSGATNLQLQSGGAFVFNNGVLSLPAANRKDFGTEFTGTLTASDNNPDTADGTYKITVLLSEKLESVKFTGLDNNNKAIYIFNSSNPDTFDYANHQRQVAQLDSPKSGLTLTLVGPPEKVANDGNSFEWNSSTGEVRKREFILDSNRPSADGVYAFTLRHVSPNPAIVPVALGLTMRFAPIEPVTRLNGRDDSIRMTGVLTVTAAQENPGDEVGVITATPESEFFDLDYLGFVKFTQSAETHGLTVQGTPKVGDPITLDIDRENTNLAAGDKLSLVIAYDHNLGGFERPVKFTMNVLYQPTGLGAPTARPKSAEQSHFSTQSDAPVHRLKGSSVEQFADGTNPLFELRVPNNGVDAAGERPRMTETKNDGFVVSEDTSNPLGWDVAMKPDVAAAGQLLTLIVAFNDSNTEFGNQATDPVSATLVMQYGYSPIAAAVLNAADVEIDLTNPITIRRAVGNVSVFVGKLSASGGSGSGYTYTLGVGELGLDEASGEVYIPDSEVPTAPGKLLTLALDIADDDGTVLAEFRVSVLYQLGEPLSGSFVAVAPTPQSRIVGEIRAGERLTVYGLASDSTSDNLPVFNLSHTNNDANLSKVSGDLILGNGGVVELPGANRKSFGRTFEGVFAASDGNVATADAKYSVTILVAERLDDLEITDKNNGGLLQYFWTTGKDGATDLRPLGRLRPTQSGLELAVPANYEWDAASGVIRRSGVPTTGNNGRATETFTLSDPADNPKIVPKEFSIVVRSYELPALAFDSPDASVKINHDAQPTSPLWTFRVSGGALTRKPYRPFHNFEVSHEGAAFNIVTARVAKGGSTTEEFVDIEVRLNTLHADFVRDGRTLTITVSAEDIGYPGLGEVSHVAVAELEAKPLSLGFAATALDSGSRVVGDLSGRVTVYGLADDATDGADLQLFKIANLIATDLRLNENGDFLFDGGVLSLPAANRKDFGTEFTGTLTASDTNSNAADATYSVTVLLSEKLGEDVRFTGLAPDGKAVYIYNSSHTTFNYQSHQRQVAQLTSPRDGLELVIPPETVPGDNNSFVWNSNGNLLKRESIAFGSTPADRVYTFTLRDPSANPKIVPVELGLTMRFEGLANVDRLNNDVPDHIRLLPTLTVTVAHENPGDVVGVMTVTPDGGFADLDYLSYVNFTRSEQNHGLKVRGTPKAGDALTLDIDGTAANLAAGARLSAVITYANNLGGFEPESKFTLEALYQPTGLGAPTALPKSAEQNQFSTQSNAPVHRLKPSVGGAVCRRSDLPLFELRVPKKRGGCGRCPSVDDHHHQRRLCGERGFVQSSRLECGDERQCGGGRAVADPDCGV